jgi:hypothetical protein
MNIALYEAAAITWLPGTFILPGETGTFANFWRANSSYHRANLRSAVAAPSSIHPLLALFPFWLRQEAKGLNEHQC